MSRVVGVIIALDQDAPASASAALFQYRQYMVYAMVCMGGSRVTGCRGRVGLWAMPITSRDTFQDLVKDRRTRAVAPGQSHVSHLSRTTGSMLQSNIGATDPRFWAVPTLTESYVSSISSNVC
jgi:hypothetical protein